MGMKIEERDEDERMEVEIFGVDEKEGEETERIDFVNVLPVELTLKIFDHLSTGELSRCLLLNREWYYLASDPILWRKHFVDRFLDKNNPEKLLKVPERSRKRCKSLLQEAMRKDDWLRAYLKQRKLGACIVPRPRALSSEKKLKMFRMYNSNRYLNVAFVAEQSTGVRTLVNSLSGVHNRVRILTIGGHRVGVRFHPRWDIRLVGHLNMPIDLIVYCYDMSDAMTLRFVEDATKSCGWKIRDVPVVLWGLKSDLLLPESETALLDLGTQPVSGTTAEELAFNYGMSCHRQMSGLKNQGTVEALEESVLIALNGHIRRRTKFQRVYKYGINLGYKTFKSIKV